MKPGEFMSAAKVPLSLKPQEFGLWTIHRQFLPAEMSPEGGAILRFTFHGDHQTILSRLTQATLHKPPGEIVMEDSRLELERHLPIWLAARGRVLVTGLGLGCVVRGLLASSAVEHVDVVEIDPQILRVVGAEFAGDPRVTLHHGDALELALPGRWDFAWHDLFHDEGNVALQEQHIMLMARFRDRVPRQGAWGFPRVFKPMVPGYLG